MQHTEILLQNTTYAYCSTSIMQGQVEPQEDILFPEMR